MASIPGPQPINWALLGSMGPDIGGGIRSGRLNNIFANGVPMKDGVPDYGTMMDALARAGFTEEALAVGRYADGADSRFGVNLVFDDQGNAYRADARSPDMVPVAPPGGGRFTQPYTWGNTGTSLTPLPKNTVPGQAQPVPIDVAGQQAAQEKGKISGQSEATLPDAIKNTQVAVEAIDLALQHPGRETATGKSSWADPRNYFAGTEASSYREGTLEQVKGQSFLASIQQMRGLGHLSDAEGRAATDAHQALKVAQTDEDHRMSLLRLKAIVMRGLIRQYQKAGQELDPQLVGAWQQAEQESGLNGMIPFAAKKSNDGSASPTSGGWTDLGNGIRIRQK